eukprot:tig00000093_g3561.t1
MGVDGGAQDWLQSMLAWKDQVSSEKRTKLKWYTKYAERYGVDSPFSKQFLDKLKQADFRDAGGAGTRMLIEAARTDHIRDDLELNKRLEDASPLRAPRPCAPPPRPRPAAPPPTPEPSPSRRQRGAAAAEDRILAAARDRSLAARVRAPARHRRLPPAPTAGSRPPATGGSRPPATAESLERRMDELVAAMMADRQAAAEGAMAQLARALQAAQQAPPPPSAGLGRASSTPALHGQPGAPGLSRMRSTPALGATATATGGGRVSTAEVQGMLDDEDYLVLLPPIGPKTIVPRPRKLVPLPEDHDMVLPKHRGWLEPAKPRRISDFFSPLDNSRFYESSEWTYQTEAARKLLSQAPSALSSPTPTVYNMRNWIPKDYVAPRETVRPRPAASPAPFV